MNQDIFSFKALDLAHVKKALLEPAGLNKPFS